MQTPDLSASVYQLRIVAQGISPLLWRFLARGDMSLAGLHDVLQITFAWSHVHLHGFQIHGKERSMRNAFWNRLSERKYLVLLLTVASTIVVQPLAHGFLAGLIIYEVLRNLLVVTVLFIVFQRRHVRLVSLLIGLPVIASNWAHYTVPERFEPALAVIHHAFLVALLGFAVTVILRRIFERKVVGGDDVIGAICGYLLAGIAWGSLYLLVELLVPGSFSVQQAIAGRLGGWYARQSVFDYYSLMTLTTLGYGDITPIRPPATSLTWMEAVFGQFYIAVIVAQLVGLRLAEALRPPAPKSTCPPGTCAGAHQWEGPGNH